MILEYINKSLFAFWLIKPHLTIYLLHISPTVIIFDCQIERSQPAKLSVDNVCVLDRMPLVHTVFYDID